MNKLFIATAMLTFATAACDDEPTTTPTPDVTVAETATDTGAETATDTGAETATDTAAETTGSTAYCMNAADFDICNQCGDADGPECGSQCPDPRAFAQGVATNCGLGCVSDADPRQCSVDCILPKTGLTNDCGGCYADIVLCSVNNCLPACLDAASAACQQCQADNCLGDFFACTGFEASCDDTVDNNEDSNTDCDDQSCNYDSACTQ